MGGVTAIGVSVWVITITFCVGLSSLLVSINRAMREPLCSGTGNRTGSTFFMSTGVELRLLTSQPSGSLAAQNRDRKSLKQVESGENIRIQQIAQYLQQATRNRLVFCHEPIDGLTFLNLGKVLATALRNENLRSPMIAYTAEDTLAEILSTLQNDSRIGNYVALYNIGILFEPALELNLKSTLENASTNKTIIIRSDGTIRSDKFYFLQPGDGMLIDLKGLSFIEI